MHAAFALRELGYETVMINSNPETVSTDFDTSDMLFFEPLTHEDVMNVVDRIAPRGVIVQFGGQTPLNLARGLMEHGAPLVGTSVDSIDEAEDRELFSKLITKLGIDQPPNGMARKSAEAIEVAERIGYPVLVRPSFVLGGRAMEVVYDRAGLESYMDRHRSFSEERPLLVDKFLDAAIEVDVDAIADGENVVIGGIMEHIEEAGIHSGDSACSLPPYSLPQAVIDEVRRQASVLAVELGVVGLMNTQFAVHDGLVYVLEVNPRASRTVPFVSKAIGVPLAKVAAKVMAGKTLAELGVREVVPSHVSVKESVFPFVKFEEVDTILGPEMRSTGEVMGIGPTFPEAYLKAQEAAGVKLPTTGVAFLSVRDADKSAAAALARDLAGLGFQLVATHGTAKYLATQGLIVRGVNKVLEGRPHCVDAMDNHEIDFVVNTTEGAQAILDSQSLRRGALRNGIAYFTTIRGARAALESIALLRREALQVCALQGYQRPSHG